jgi:hypothetical protein
LHCMVPRSVARDRHSLVTQRSVDQSLAAKGYPDAVAIVRRRLIFGSRSGAGPRRRPAPPAMAASGGGGRHSGARARSTDGLRPSATRLSRGNRNALL